MENINNLKRADELSGRFKKLVGNEGLIQLAKDGICPHYKVIHPITKEENILFIQPEVNQWFVDNYTTYISGGFTTKFDFYYFDRDNFAPKRKENVPPELIKIKDLFELPLETISTPSGIYFLCADRKIKYIGQSHNVARRICDHMNDKTKQFNSVYFITCSISELRTLESALIRYFKPEYNATIKNEEKEPTEQDVVIAEGIMNQNLFVRTPKRYKNKHYFHKKIN